MEIVKGNLFLKVTTALVVLSRSSSLYALPPQHDREHSGGNSHTVSHSSPHPFARVSRNSRRSC